MGKLILIALVVVFVIIVGGGAFLAFYDVPSPSSQVEKVLPDARFQK
jgi:flagellar basal body-associated protein FliL